jgi:two-component system, NarL family, nitrate/nitrite response regulator NarL
MKVVIIDSHYLVREGLKILLANDGSIEVIGEASEVQEGINIVLKKRPDLIIVDLKLGKEDGLNVIQEIRKSEVECKFVVLTSSADYRDFRKAKELNIDGYILKDAIPEEIIYALRIVNAGRKYYDANLMISAMNLEKNDVFQDGAIKNLTQREREVLVTLGKGFSNNDISRKLFITEYTVKKHVSQILCKLGLTDRTQAALYANAHGLVS